MKKISILLVACMLISSLAMFVNASPHGIIENDPVYMYNAAPTVDGTIGEDEGWSEPALVDYDTCGFYWQHMPISIEGKVYFAWTEDGLYYAADITEGLECIDERDGTDWTGVNNFVYSTGEDDLDIDANNPEVHYGYNGDVFGLLLDPQGLSKEEYDAMPGGLLGAGYGSDYCAWYMVGLFEEEGAKMYRQKVNMGDITDQVEVAGVKTEKGWAFEAMIPWDIIITDIADVTFGDVELTVDQILQDTGVIRAAAMYQDRFYDEEAGEVATWGRYVTAPTTQFDGTPGHMGSGDTVQSLGITLIAASDTYENPFTDVKESHWFYDSVMYCVKKGYIKGMTETTFVPNGKLTRAQFLTMLAALDGVDLDTYAGKDAGFTDVKASHWFNEEVCWAVEMGITSGLSETKFGPNNNVTRAQLARFFYVYSEKNGIDVSGKADISAYPDVAKVQDWAKDPIEWAVNAGIINGVAKDGVNYLDPNGTATRAQAAVMFMGFDAFRK